MGSTLTSARDPIFYAHHANLDRIWLEWQKKWQLDPIDLDEPLKGVPGNYLQRNWLDVSTKSAYGPKAVPTPPVPPPGPAPFVFRAEQQLVKEGLSPAFAPEQRLQPQARVLLQLTNVTYPRNVGPFVSARVYLHPKDVKPAEGGTQFCETYFLGYFTDWQGDHGPHDAAQHAAANNLTLDVTERARAIQNMAGNAELVISFEFTRQADDGKVEPLKYGGPDGVSMNVRLEVVRPENGKAVNVQSIKTTQLP
jgi:hypothetical protein